MELSRCIFPIYSSGTIIGQGFVADGYFITAAHVVKDFPECFAVLNGKRFELSKEEPAFIGEGDISHDPLMMDIVLYPFDGIDSPLHLFDYSPRKGDSFENYCVHEVTNVNSLNPRFKLTMEPAVPTGDEEGNYFYCNCKRFNGSSGSPLLKENEVVGIMHGGDGNKICAFLKVKEVIRHIRVKSPNTCITEKDKESYWVDECGVYYSSDKQKILGTSNKELTTYSIIKGTKVICDWAFHDCTNLVSISIPDSVISIGYRAFFECSAIESITIPQSVAIIGDAAFHDCSSLRKVFLSDSISKLGNELFAGCYSLETISLPFSLKSIGDYTFSGCESLKSLTIPLSVNYIGEGAFIGCNCEIISLSNQFVSDGVLLYTAITHTLIYCPIGICKLEIPDTINRIGKFALCDCLSLRILSFPPSLREIEDNAISGCDYLTMIVIPTGTRQRFEKLLPEYKEKLFELSNATPLDFKNAFNDISFNTIGEGEFPYKGKRFGGKKNKTWSLESS